MTTHIALSANMIELLVAHRELLNQMFRRRKAFGTKIDSQAWSQHVGETVLPVVQAVQHIAEERARTTLIDLYEVSLDLFAAGHFSESGNSPTLMQLWKEVLPCLAKTLSRSPKRIAGSFSNAVVALTMESPEIAKRWLGSLQRICGACETPQQLLDVGKVLAWTSGMAIYRHPALVLTQDIHISLLRRLFEVSDTVSENHIRQWLTDLDSNPWYRRPFDKKAGQAKVQQVSRCGAFRGFGGLFLEPPVLFLHDGQIFVSESRNVYQLVADSFGYAFQRMANFEPKKHSQSTTASINAQGLIRWQGCDNFQSDLVDVSSQAYDGNTLAITLTSSFHVYLFAKLTS